MSFFCLLLLLIVIFSLASGYPVAFALGGGALITSFIGILTGHFESAFLFSLPERIYGIMNNESLVAIPLFIFMGLVLEKSNIAKDLLEAMGELAGGSKTSLSLSVFAVGALLAASTGIVGATVVTMGLISLPSLLKKNVPQSLSCGIVAASGTLGQIIPPSIVLIVLGDVISSANQQAQINQGVYNTTAVSVGDLFIGALLPGFILVGFYMLYVTSYFIFSKQKNLKTKGNLSLKNTISFKELFKRIAPPLLLVILVLGSILFGFATPTEAASVGCVGALAISFIKKQLDSDKLSKALSESIQTTSMVFLILIGANILSVVFRGYGGDDLVASLLSSLGDNPAIAFSLVMLLIFVLGFFLDFFEITFVVVPLVGPALIEMGLDPVWLGVMIAMNLQTSFLTPPFGFSLFYLRGVAPKEISTTTIYKGVVPFIGIQILTLVLLWFFPSLVTTLPKVLLG